MVSLMTVGLMASAGLMLYLAIPFVAMSLPIKLRQRIGDTYFGLAAKCLKQFTLIRRVMSGYDVKTIDVDDEQKLIKATLDSSMTGEDSEFPFKDPDNRIGRVHGKPLALTYEIVPAAVDAELAELGHHQDEKAVNEGGLWHGRLDAEDPYQDITVNPWLEVPKKPRLVDPKDAMSLVVNGVEAETIKTAEKKTKQRFEKYDNGIDATQLLTGVLGFAAGLGGMMALRFFQNKVLDGGGVGGGGGSPIPQPIMLDVMDAVVMLV